MRSGKKEVPVTVRVEKI
jgi:hypothetical protein